MRIFSESPLDRRDHTNRLSYHIIHEFRFSRIDFCSAARCRQRAGESGSFRRVAVQRDPRLLVLALQRLEHAHRHEQPHDVGGIRLRVEALKRVRIRLRKEARKRKRLLRPTSCLHGNLPRPLDRHGCAHRAIARRITRIFVSRASAFARLRAAASAPESAVGRKRRRKRLLRPTPRFHGNLPRPLDRHGCAHRALARRITRIFVSRASAFARLHAAANAPESAVGRKRAAPACGRKWLLRLAPCLHGNLPRPLDCHGRANRALARRITRIFVSRASAFAWLRKVPACGQKRLLRPSR